MSFSENDILKQLVTKILCGSFQGLYKVHISFIYSIV